MSNFQIRYWDDNIVSRNKIQAPLMDLETTYPHIKYSEIAYMELLKADDIKNTCRDIDLLILDLLNEKDLKEGDRPSTIGVDILAQLRQLKIDIPIIVYSDALNEKNTEISFIELKRDYPDVVFIKKSDDKTTDILKQEITKAIIEKLPDQFEVSKEYKDEFSQQLFYFGRKELNELLREVKTIFSINPIQKIKLDKMKSGFSGAILFKFIEQNTEYILKVSRDIDLLKKEFEKSEQLYGKFPSKFFNHISHKIIHTSTKSSVGIIIKLIPNSITLFDFILQAKTKSEIDAIFNSIYFNNGLKDHYQTQISEEKESWTNILKKFKNGRFIIIENVYKDLKPLLFNFNIDEVRDFAKNNFYDKLNDKKNKHEGVKTLNHLDLHSKNILIQGGNISFLIDTGVMDYGYWAFDISRLLVDLFINGFDINTKDFFDINCISKNIDLGKSFIQLEPINYDGNNDRIIDAINWLTTNVETIYSGFFSKWELQLALMKEFLQMSYRVETVPHSKRALALELSQICMEEGTKNAG